MTLEQMLTVDPHKSSYISARNTSKDQCNLAYVYLGFAVGIDYFNFHLTSANDEIHLGWNTQQICRPAFTSKTISQHVVEGIEFG
ncbi:hypothetical protein DAPPUDRAFT_246436 [Daphnia pulex]|uniref:Uncharacterized protein n=1 Tax=Daphnia pulex TaxID=6669 RepID=E9GQH8_DAPPU|nr:hypothetical protein DAPPUDRAFT_246436 [Daphnia pulex]|eukprot:EFX78121.1 hypothetical protein DAPPUDRAFT_246436 [Daphnia pulex]